MIDDEIIAIKIILLGNPGVDKTGIISRYIDNSFDEKNPSTIGANYSVKIIKKNFKEYELDIWDTAGQEKFHSIGKHFYKDAYIVCLVYDITNQESLDSLKTTWYPDLLKYGEKNPILAVVGNKCDLYESECLADENEAKEFAKEIGAVFMLTSAKTGDGIEKLFDIIVDKYLEQENNYKYKEMIEMKKEYIKISRSDIKKKKNKRICHK